MAAAGLLVGCGAPAVDVPAPPTATDVFVPPAGTASTEVPADPLEGEVVVAYPGEPAGFLDLLGDDPAATDLQALWGLPLFRVDPAGQLVPALVERWELVESTAGWTVRLHLAAGSWSDGSPVTAADVAATVEALRAGPRSAELSPLVRVHASDTRTVELTFARPYARWPAVLDGVGVLPQVVLEAGGLAAYDGAVPVSGGPFRLVDLEPGLELTFAANEAAPLGSPGIARVRVVVVPHYETALGLLRDGEVDALVGYLALNAVERARRVEGAAAAAPVGGTWVGLTWRDGGALGGAAGAARRRAMGQAIDVGQLVEGLLSPAGEVATSPVPGVAAPAAGADGAARRDPGRAVVVLPRGPEAVSLTARAVQRDVRTAGGELELVPEPAPRFVRQARAHRDGALRVLRSGPRPSLVPWVDDPEVAIAADATVPGTPAFTDGLAAVRETARVWPLYRVGVAHVWHEELQGIRPSAWPGLGFWNVAAWSLGPR